MKLRQVSISLTPAAVARYGAQEAIVLRQISAWIEWHPERYTDDDGHTWFDASAAELAALTGLSEPAIRREVKKLRERGLIARRDNVNGHGTQRPGFRPLVDFETGKPLDSAGDDSVSPRGDDSVTRAGDDSVSPTSVSKEEMGDSNPCSPLRGRGPEELPLDDRVPGEQRREATRKTSTASLLEASFELWWSDWPSGKGRGQKATTLTAWKKRLTAGKDRNGDALTAHELTARQLHFREARVLYREFWKARGVEASAPLMNGATFVNSKSTLWAEPWTEEDLSYWPPPRGYSWDDAPSSGGYVIGSGMFQALNDEIAGEAS